MSFYCHEKVLRVPCATYGIKDPWEIESMYNALFNKGYYPKFAVAPTELNYIDYVLFSEIDGRYGEFGKSRELTETEKNKYLHIFQRIIPEINMDDVKLIEYCYYNATEAPDYYDDDFLEEI